MSALTSHALRKPNLNLSQLMQSGVWAQGGSVYADLTIVRILPEPGQSAEELEALIHAGRASRLILLASHEGAEYPVYVLKPLRRSIEHGYAALRSSNPVSTISRIEGELDLAMDKLAKLILAETTENRPVRLGGMLLQIVPADEKHHRPLIRHTLNVTTNFETLRRRIDLLVETTQAPSSEADRAQCRDIYK